MYFQGCKRVFGVLLTISVMTGCAGWLNIPPEDRVLARSQERLDLLRAREVEKAFEYATPGYKAGHTVLQYDKRFGGAKTLWMDARAMEAQCDRSGDLIDRCKVRVEVDYTTRSLGYIETTDLIETWILTDGQWHLFIE